MAFPTTSVLDQFNRADGALGAAWSGAIPQSGDPQPTILSNVVQFGSNHRSVWWNAGTFGPDSEVFGVVSTKPTNAAGWLSLYARIQSPGSAAWDGYRLEFGPLSGTDELTVDRMINNASTTLATITQEINAGDQIGMEVTGTGATVTIRVYRHNGTSWAQIGSDVSDTDANRITAAGYIGFGAFESTPAARFDDFGGGTVSVAGATSLLVPRRATRGLVMR